MSKAPWNRTPAYVYDNMIEDVLEKELNTVDTIIRTMPVWEKLKDKMGYQLCMHHVRRVMGTMVELGKAKKLSAGKWRVLRPNDPTVKQKHGIFHYQQQNRLSA